MILRSFKYSFVYLITLLLLSLLFVLVPPSFGGSPDKMTSKSLLTQSLNQSQLAANSFTWLGHSIVLLKTSAKILQVYNHVR